MFWCLCIVSVYHNFVHRNYITQNFHSIIQNMKICWRHNVNKALRKITDFKRYMLAPGVGIGLIQINYKFLIRSNSTDQSGPIQSAIWQKFYPVQSAIKVQIAKSVPMRKLSLKIQSGNPVQKYISEIQYGCRPLISTTKGKERKRKIV